MIIFLPTKNGTKVKDNLKAGLNNYANVNGISYSGNYYDDLNGAVINQSAINNGLTIEIDGITFDILQTWSPADTRVNSNSLVMKMTAKGQTTMFLGDAGVESGIRLLKTYIDNLEILESDIIKRIWLKL